MIKRYKFLWLVVLFVGGLAGLATAMAFTPQDKGISETHDAGVDSVALLPIRDPHLQEALRLMLTSDQRWESLDVRGRYTEYAYQADAQSPSVPHGEAVGKTVFVEEVEIHQPFDLTYRQYVGDAREPRYQVTIHNGSIREEPHIGDKEPQVSETALSPTRLQNELAFLPRTLQQIRPGTIIDYPLVRQIPARIMDMLFPTWIAQQAVSPNRLSFEGEAQWLGRPAYRIRLEKPGGGTAVITAWVDQQTGVLLRYRYEVGGVLLAEYDVQEVKVK